MRTTVGLIVLAWVALCGGATAQQPARLDRASIVETVEGIATVVNLEYFDPDVAARVAASLKQRLAQGKYSVATTREALARMVTEDLFAATRDKHLAVAVDRDKHTGPSSRTGTAGESREVTGRRSNFGVRRVEVLAGNVGYLNLTHFYRLEEARDGIAAAMQTLRYADALILDMRDNGGGSPDTAALVASYLFEASGLPLFEIVPRSGTGGLKYTTDPSAVAGRNGTRPAYVLTARRTFSAGEGFAFILQERRRAMVVGERTAGAANPGRPYPVSPGFSVTVPNGKVRTAVTGRNWEGVGVVPDVAVAAPAAMRVAHMRALRDLLKLTPEGAWRDTLERQLDALTGRDRVRKP